jgi:hypothetical protein
MNLSMYFRRLRSNRITDMEMNYMNNYSQTLKASLGNLRNDSDHEYFWKAIKWIQLSHWILP